MEIFHEILSACQKPASRTRIVYRCNLNFGMLKKYLDVLSEMGLIGLTDSEANGFYQATDKGKEFVQHYRHMISLINNRQMETSIVVSIYSDYIPRIHEL
jgi:predicted transcriptional regulator